MEDPTGIIPGWKSYNIRDGQGGGCYCSQPDFRLPRWCYLFAGIGIGLVIWWILAPVLCHGRQTRPDPKRQAQIRAALVEHGYRSGVSWPETQEILRQIARERHWQHTYAPDARVLILLGLGNRYSDPDILTWGPTRLTE